MTGHKSTVNNSNDDYPNRSFFAWLRSNTALFIAQMFAIISIVYTITAAIYYIGHNEDLFAIKAETIQEFVNYAHLLFVLIVVVILFMIIKESEHGKTRAKLAHENMFKSSLELETVDIAISQVKYFKRYFLLFWVSIGFLYAGFMIEKNVTIKHQINSEEYIQWYNYEGKDTPQMHRYAIKIPANTQYIEGFKIDSLYQYKNIENYLFKTNNRRKAVKYIGGEWIPLFFNTVSSMFIFWCYSAEIRRHVCPDRGRNRRRLDGAGRELRRARRGHGFERAGHLVENRGARLGVDGRGAGGHRGRAARRAFDRHADECRAERPEHRVLRRAR